MATTHAGPGTGHMAAAISMEQPILLRRLLITCPATGLSTDTGFELSQVPSVIAGPQLLVDCLECGQDHEWGIDDVTLDRFAAAAADAAGSRTDR